MYVMHQQKLIVIVCIYFGAQDEYRMIFWLNFNFFFVWFSPMPLAHIIGFSDLYLGS